jgi:UDP-glucose-4-epimerase GalE
VEENQRCAVIGSLAQLHRFSSMSKSILVTGGAGYVGSHACKVLAGAGYRPVIYDNLSRGHAEAVRWGPLVEGDLHDHDKLVAALRSHEIAAVMHFAAFAYVGESVGEPDLYYRNNVGGTLALLAAMREAGVGTIVFSSTCAVYGVPDKVPIGESTAKAPLNPYGETKLVIEQALHWYGGAYGLRYAALRYFNAAGADPGGEIGEDHDPETHLIPRVLRAALGRGDPVEIYGTDYPTPDGTAIRDYIHVTDLADAHVRALGHLERGGSIALNLGTGQGASVREVIAAVERVAGRPVPQREAPRRPGDPPELVADPALARERLGWQPRYSDLDTIVATALAWENRVKAAA